MMWRMIPLVVEIELGIRENRTQGTLSHADQQGLTQEDLTGSLPDFKATIDKLIDPQNQTFGTKQSQTFDFQGSGVAGCYTLLTLSDFRQW